MTYLSRWAAAALFAIIVFVTLSPISLRPMTGHPNAERAIAFLLLGLAVGFGFPKRLIAGAIFVVGVAGLLEVLQVIDPTRHGRLDDMIVKAVGGLVGILVAKAVVQLLR